MNDECYDSAKESRYRKLFEKGCSRVSLRNDKECGLLYAKEVEGRFGKDRTV